MPELQKSVIGLTSRGISAIPHLRAFLPEVASLRAPFLGYIPGRIDAVAGWGLKRSGLKAREIAARRNITCLTLEDGFLRSFGLGVEGVPPLSLVVDRSGIYYDATAPSDLENMLQQMDMNPALLMRAETAMAWLMQERLTKYNKAAAPLSADFKPIKRLIIDQTMNDASVCYSGAAQNAFSTMIDDALAHYNAADIAVKLHPDTITGHKGGYLRELAHTQGIRLIDTPIDPWDLLNHTDQVATVSSQMGFDALMAGKTVRCYGMPFYAGWGLTQDSVANPRRTRQRSVSEIFAAAYLCYARYVDPFTGSASTLEKTIALLSDLSRYDRKLQTPLLGFGFSPWKQRYLPHFFEKKIIFPASFNKLSSTQPVIWASKDIPAKIQNENIWRMEDGFVRSQGLGSKLVRPWSLVVDTRGIYFDPQKPSDLEHILQNAEMPEGLLQRAAAIRETLISSAISKYNTGVTKTFVKPEGKKIILVPGQVEDDASIRTGASNIRTNLALLRDVRTANPDAHIIYKPHPDVEAGKRTGQIRAEQTLEFCNEIVSDCNIATLFPMIDELHTMTSLAGFEALLRGKQVHVYGQPFYAGWGLTHDRCNFMRRTRRLSLDQLVAGTLVLYPFYFDWQSKRLCNIETVLKRWSNQA